jgi:predicted NAD/FAD-binding protein
MKVAVIGAGVSGLGAAFALKDSADVVLYEKDARLGGHANTTTIEYGERRIDVDTGFIVYNTRNYPNLVGLFETLGVDSFQTDMSFAFAGGALEWSSNFPGGVFAQKRNLASPRFLRMLADIRRFNRIAIEDLDAGRLDDLTLGGYLRLRGFSPAFEASYLLPMGAAIWSTNPCGIGSVPAESFVRFFANHSLLQMVQPKWRTVRGGSRTYVEKLARVLGRRARAGVGVRSVRRIPGGGVEVRDDRGGVDRFDQIIFASHSDQALAMLGDADIEERAFLGAIRYAPNKAYLHRDPTLMPNRRAAWGSWNYLVNTRGEQLGGVTYWMNGLQGIDRRCPLFVSLNPITPPAPELTFGVYDYDHPQFDTASLAAQRRFGRVQGRGGVWYAGAWLGYGFHEDGLTAGLRVAHALGGRVPWAFVDHRIAGGPLRAPQPRIEAPRRAATG